MMKEKKTSDLHLRLLKIIPLAVMAAIILVFGSTLRTMTFEDIVGYTPQSPILAALALWGIYAVKSLSVVFPLVALYIGAGLVFAPLAALAVNLVGMMICVSIPYAIGRFSCGDLAVRLVEKYPKVRKAGELGSRNHLFTAYLLRVVGFMPGDVVSLFLGASRLPYPTYLVGSLLGLAPTMVLYTLLGSQLDNPFSPGFLLPLAGLILLSLGSTFLISKKTKSQK